MDALPKLPVVEPNTDESERIAAALIVDHDLQYRPPQPPLRLMGRAQLKPVWTVDFYRGRPEQP